MFFGSPCLPSPTKIPQGFFNSNSATSTGFMVFFSSGFDVEAIGIPAEVGIYLLLKICFFQLIPLDRFLNLL